ncbi:uncharacterized protein LOC120088987 [Benincasa hispida]|uniref:uncharacterized protein LOC120088987 n=1 Tax=Benincasa hispida TaxID=102211 RepID=UPI001900643A|nr:uncharacterized protein LOC120088987 [Benincasa hispida]
MKKSGFIAASVAAAAVSASPSSSTLVCNPKVQFPRQEGKEGENSSSSTDKFAPKFDGLRFIETLVTAHR